MLVLAVIGNPVARLHAQAAAATPAARPIAPDRLMPRLHALAHDSMEGRGAGTPGGVRGRAYIEAELRAMGVAPAGDAYQVPVRVRARPGADSLGANVVARIPGRASASGRSDAPVLVLSAHHDHLGIRNDSIYNGADDDASGSVALLALAERFTAEPLEHDVILAWFEAEESGMLGSRAFVAAPPVPIERIALNVNLDMVSRHEGGGALWVAGTAHYPYLRPIAESAVPRASIPIRFGHDTASARRSDDWTGASDHASFHRAGVPFLYLGVEDHPDYHKPGDDADKVDPAFYSASVSFTEALVRTLDAQLGAVHAARPATP
jgi:Zn-dependent M28 family amino/carboxypeptidase